MASGERTSQRLAIHIFFMVGTLFYLLMFGVASSQAATAELVTKWGGPGTGNGQFNALTDVDVDQSGDVYVAEWGGNERIQKFDSSGNFLTKWGSSGSGDGQFLGIGGVSADAFGNVYTVESGANYRIQKFDSTGTFSTKWGSGGSGDGQFAAPYGLDVDPLGNVYAADYSNSRIQSFDSSGTFSTKWGSAGSGDGQFSGVRGLAIDSSGNVYTVEQGNRRVQKFTADGTFTIKWGSSGSGDGQFSAPWDIEVDALGYVYVTDSSNNRIQKFDSSGNFLTKWGSPGSGDGQFNTPRGIAVDSLGYIYVSDAGNDRIQKFGNTQAHTTATVDLGDAVVTFSEVIDGGETTLAVSAPAFPAPSGLSILGDQYDINTSANSSGTVLVTVPYDEGLVSGDESKLKIFHWNGVAWEDVTISVNTVNNTITAQTTSLSPFVVAGDVTAPTGTIKIKKGAPATKNKATTLNLTAADPAGSGVDKVRYRNGGSTWSTWQAFRSTKSWTLTSGQGTKRVYYQIKDKAGNTSVVVSDTIKYDSVAPRAYIRSPWISTNRSKTTKWEVRWFGVDKSPSSGIKNYTVKYRADNSSTWRFWKVNITKKKATLTGKPGRTYTYKSIVRDKAVNQNTW